jgi:hypothetical protein
MDLIEKALIKYKSTLDCMEKECGGTCVCIRVEDKNLSEMALSEYKALLEEQEEIRNETTIAIDNIHNIKSTDTGK